MNEENYNYKNLHTTVSPSYGEHIFYCGDNSANIDADGTVCIFDGLISTTTE